MIEKPELIPEWRSGWKFWSVRLNTVGTLMMTVFLVAPETMLFLWQMVPPEARSVLPPRVVMVVPLILFAAGTVARIVKQRKLDRG